MYIKSLAENLVQKASLLFDILSFEVYCRSIATLRLNDTRVVFRARELPNSQYKRQGKKIRETVMGGKQCIQRCSDLAWKNWDIWPGERTPRVRGKIYFAEYKYK